MYHIDKTLVRDQMVVTHGTMRSFFSRAEIITACESVGYPAAVAGALLRQMFKVGRGAYSFDEPLPEVTAAYNSAKVAKVLATPAPATIKMVSGVTDKSGDAVFVPDVDDTFVAWGNFANVKKALSTRQFFPIYISGLSGNGKTFMVEQACAQAKREYVRVQISPETDEDDLIGGFRLIGGETVFQKGPVLRAMESGAVLLIDEIDRGTNKIMCLQGVLEGKPVMIKKTGEVVSPASGFTVISTANTKGRGSDDGRYSAAGIIDDAFLERFVVTIEQPYPSRAIETKIVKKHMDKFDVPVTKFADKLTAWSEIIRKTFEDGGVDEFISTRRLCHVVQTFSVFEDEKKAISLCIARFDDDTKTAFVDLYDKLGDDPAPAVNDETSNDLPYPPTSGTA